MSTTRIFEFTLFYAHFLRAFFYADENPIRGVITKTKQGIEPEPNRLFFETHFFKRSFLRQKNVRDFLL